MKNSKRAWIFFGIFAAVVVVALISWIAFDWQKRPNGLIEMLGVVILAVLASGANVVSILKDSKDEKGAKTVFTGNSLNVIGDVSNVGPMIGQQTINNYPPTTTPKEEPEKLPRLPERGKLPPVGVLPQGSHVPFARNACFTGRDADLLVLADAMLYADQTGRETVTQMLSITGLGGMGKSQLAVEYCHRFGRYYEGVHWLNCRDGRLESEIASCGLQMNLLPWPEKQPELVEVTLRAWEDSRRRLLVLDNLEDPEVLRTWLPRLNRCRLLITARRSGWPADLGVQTHPLGLLASAESRELLRRLAPRLERTTDADLNAIAEKLGYLPLALDLAGRYLNDRETLSPTSYQLALNEQENLLQHNSLLSWVEDGSPTGHETSLATTFQLSWQRLEGQDVTNSLARRVFELGGWCAPNIAIPREILAQACSAPNEDFDRALVRLAGLGLVEQLPGGPALHPLLAAFAQSLQAPAEKNALLSMLTNALTKLSIEANNTGLPQAFTLLRLHLECLAPVAEQAGVVEVSGLWNYLGLYLQMIADLAGAKACLERALRINEATYGLEHPTVAKVVNNLGTVLWEQGDLAGAKACLERALRIVEASYGVEDPTVARFINNLGTVLREQGDLAGAKACFERALRIYEATDSVKQPWYGTVVNNLGSVLRALGDPVGAKVCYERALRINEATYGVEHPRVASDVNNLGNVLQDQGDLAGANVCYERALRIDEATYGGEHPTVARDVNNLGSVLRALGDPAEAKAFYKRALRIDEAAYGQDHPEVARDVNNLGSVLQDQGDLAGARACFERALHIDEAAYGPEHPDVARDVNNLGTVLWEQGELQRAKGCLERALRIDEAAFGAEHPTVARVVNNLGCVLQALGDLAGAKACYEHALRIDEVTYGAEHQRVARIVNNLGSVLQDQGDLPGAKAFYERALRIDEAVYGEEHPEVATDVNNLGSVLKALGELSGAKVCFERALRILEKIPPIDHSMIQVVRQNLEILDNSRD